MYRCTDLDGTVRAADAILASVAGGAVVIWSVGRVVAEQHVHVVGVAVAVAVIVAEEHDGGLCVVVAVPQEGFQVGHVGVVEGGADFDRFYEGAVGYD